MRRTITTLLTVGVLALPVAQATAAVKATKKVVIKKFTGTAYQADRWGALQVTIVVRKTRPAEFKTVMAQPNLCLLIWDRRSAFDHS